MRRYTITVNDTTSVIDVEELTADTYRVQLDGRHIDVRLDDHRGLAHAAIAPGVEVSRAAAAAPAAPAAAPIAAKPAASGSSSAPARPAAAASRPAAAPAGGGGSDRLDAPMPGVLLEIKTSVGAQVSRGDTLMILEAMKMKNELKAPRDGVVAEIYVSEGASVKFGEPLVRFEGN